MYKMETQLNYFGYGGDFECFAVIYLWYLRNMSW